MIELDTNKESDKSKEKQKIISLDNYKYISNNDQIRAKQEKLNELINNNDSEYAGVGTRRTTRKHMLVKNNLKNNSERVIIST